MTKKVTEVTKDAWVDITAVNVTSITFQNIGQWPMYIAFSGTATAPSDTHGAYYKTGEGELKKALTDLTYVASPVRVFAKAVSHKTTVFAEF